MEKLSKELKEKLFLNMYNEGLKDSQIARILEISEAVVNQLRWSKKLPAINSIDITDEEFLKIAKNNDSKVNIARIANISEAAVIRRCKKLGIEVRKKTIEERKNEFLKLYNEGLSDANIAEKLKFGAKTVKNFRESLKLKKNNNRIKIKYNDFINYYKDFKTDQEIAQFLNVTQSAVSRFRKDHNLPINKAIDKEIILTNKEYQVLIGSLLGDAYLSKNSAGNIIGGFTHCVKQKDFVLHKYEILKNICSQPRIKKLKDERFKVKEYEQISVTIRSFANLKNIYNNFYEEGKKIVKKEILEQLDGLGLAIWFMDDGSNAKYGYILCTNGFNNNDRKVIQEVFKNKFNLETTIRKTGEIYIKAESKEIFKSLIQPYIIPSMQYKL